MAVTALAAVLNYAARGWRIFPCRSDDKRPIITDWPDRASRNAAKLGRWSRRWPNALIGCPTGHVNGFVVLDVDLKDPARDGRDTLDGFGILPTTRISHTRSGGFHLHFVPPAGGLRNTGGARGRGIGPGLDWRGDGGFVILPSPDSGYWWDPHYGIDAPLAAVPPELLPREPTRAAPVRPVKPATGLSPYAEAALDSACRRIIAAPNGEQRDTLNAECFAIGGLAGAGAISADFARRALVWAATHLPSYDPQQPWRVREIHTIVSQAFEDGLRRPRGGHHGGLG